MGRSRIEGGEFSVDGGYVFYTRLKEDNWINRFLGVDITTDALENLGKQKEQYNLHTWQVVADQLMETGLAEQEKERRLLSALGNNDFNGEIKYEDYPKYIEAINKLVGLKDKYRTYLHEVKAQANDDKNRRAAGGFRYFESRIATAINQGIKESMQNLSQQELIQMPYDQIQKYVEDSISKCIERAIEKVANSEPGYLQEKVKIWKDISDGFKNLNSSSKNLFIQTIMDRYNLNDISSQITDWLFKNFKNPRRKKDLFWGSGTAIKSSMKVNERKGSSIDGFISEFIPSLLNASIGKGTGFASNEFKSDSVEFFNIRADIDIDEILNQATFLNPGEKDNSEIVNRMNKFTEEVLDKAEEIFVVYDSSKMYRLSGKFSTRGFGGASGVLENLGVAMAQFGAADQLNSNVAHVLYQTMKGAILEGENQKELIEKVRREIISCITTTFFDDVEFQKPSSKGDNVIHMLTLDAIRIPMSFYCIALSKAISAAADEMNSKMINNYINVTIKLPKKIKFPDNPTEEDEKVVGFEGKKFPSSLYAAWKAQRQEAISQSTFTIHFLKNFEKIIDGLITGNLKL